MTSTCPACGGHSAASWRLAHELDHGLPREPGLPLLRCGDCGSAWLEDPPSDGRDLHETGPYAPKTGLSERLPAAARSLLDRDRLRLLGPLDAGSRVIEVGSGRGRLLAALRERGHDAVGIEPSRASAEAAIARGLPVETTSVEEAGFPAGEADLVVFWHVLEHLDAPGDALAAARSWLRLGGRLVVAVPNLASLQARIGGDRWFHQDVPRHRTQFTLAGVVALVERGGYGVAGVRQLMLEQNTLGMWLTLLNGLTAGRDVPFRALKRDLRYRGRGDGYRDALVCAVAGVPLLALAALAEGGAGLAGRAGTVVVRARAG